jgi:hypothetical protein
MIKYKFLAPYHYVSTFSFRTWKNFVELIYKPLWYSGEGFSHCTTKMSGSDYSVDKKCLHKKPIFDEKLVFSLNFLSMSLVARQTYIFRVVTSNRTKVRRPHKLSYDRKSMTKSPNCRTTLASYEIRTIACGHECI